MKRSLALAALLVAAVSVDSALAQDDRGPALAEFDRIAGSVIRIRTIADLEYERLDNRTGERRVAVRPYSVDGSGIVVGEIEVDGNREYLILTNHHVADASNYVLQEDGYLRVNPTNTLALPSVPEQSYVIENPEEPINERSIQLVEVVRQVRGDMTLMRTVGASRRMTVYQGRIGHLEGEIDAGAPILTSGYPLGARRVIELGHVVATDYPHELGLTHDDLLIDLQVQPGQSGGPIFLIEEDAAKEGEVELRLIGLVHAKDRERSYAVPYALWMDSLEEFPVELQTRLVR